MDARNLKFPSVQKTFTATILISLISTGFSITYHHDMIEDRIFHTKVLEPFHARIREIQRLFWINHGKNHLTHFRKSK